MARELVDEVSAACAAGSPGSMEDRIEAAAVLARSFGPPLSGAVRVAQHRVHRWYRVQRDRRKLAYFVPRAQALAAFEELLAGRPAIWALHYVGVGGAGKTSLIRYLATELAQERGLQIARIDFDHLSPAYPAHDPGQLIAALVYELTSQIESEDQDKLLGFIDSTLHLLRSSPPPATSNVQAILDAPAVQELTSWFGSLLQSFTRPIFILDTCEELTKLDVTDDAIPSVEATFLLLDRLHQQAPDLRVVFAGRRLLAGAYANWEAPAEATPRRGGSARRDHVRLHELRGFDEPEARDYLSKRLPVPRRGDEPLIRTLLALSPEPSRVRLLHRADDGGAGYFNPFDLARYAEWVDAVPDVRIEDFAAVSADPYVEVRILQRMGALEGLLPGVVLLRRFDAATLALALPAGADPARAFDELSRHKWLRVLELDGRMVLELGPGLPARIERCLAATRALELDRARAQLAARLRAQIESRRLREIPVEVHDAALRMLGADDAVALWRAIEQRIGAEADWAWAAELTRKLIAEGYAGEHAEELIGAAIRATHASAMIHAGGDGAGVIELWLEVQRGAARALERAGLVDDPGTTGRRRSPGSSPAWLLFLRADLGIVAAEAARAGAPQIGEPELIEWVARVGAELTRWGHRHTLDTSMCAAIEALIERAERTLDRTTYWRLGALRRLTQFEAPGLAAFGAALRRRIRALDGPEPEIEADREFGDPELDDPGMPATLVDWRSPEVLRDRLRLERVRIARDGDISAKLAQHWWDQAEAEKIDGDRLRSALITRGLVSSTELPKTTPPLASEVCAAHRTFPPLAFALARRHLARGEVSAARALCERLVQPWAARLACEIARWSRDPGDLDGIGWTDTIDERTAGEVAAARAIVEGRATRGTPDVLGSWPFQVARTRDEVIQLVDRVRPRLAELEAAAGRSELARGHLVLRELAMLSRYTDQPIPPPPDLALPQVDAVHPDLREQALRLHVRGFALGTPVKLDAATGRLLEIAVEEAELLDLRLPEAALRLFDWVEAQATRLELAPIRCRAALGGLIAAIHAGDARIDHRSALLNEQLERPQNAELARYREAVDRRRIAAHAIAVFDGEREIQMTYFGRARPGLTWAGRARSWLARERGASVIWAAVMVAIGVAVLSFQGLAVPLFEGALLVAATVTMLVLLLLPKAAAALWKLVTDSPERPPRTGATGPRRAAVIITPISPTRAEVVIEAEPRVDGTLRTEVETSQGSGVRPELVDGRLQETMRSLASRAEHVVCVLDPADRLATKCWEAPLYGLDERLLERLDLVRTLPVRGTGALPPAEGQAVIEASGTIEVLLRRAWGGRNVVHVVRRFARDARGTVAQTIDFSRDVVEAELGTLRLPVEAARFVVVQCELVAPRVLEQSLRSTYAEPELARELMIATLRRTSASGLVLPPMPFELVAPLLPALVEAAGDFDRASLIRAARLARLRLRDVGLRQLAVEISLFLREDTVP